jgi:hypothetical protein
MPLEPLPETREALLSMAHWSDRDLTSELVHQGELAEEIVPNLVGLSLALVRDGLTFTIAATPDQLALLDAIQYAFGGPCVDAALHDAAVLSGDSADGLLDEQRWVQFARAGAAHGVVVATHAVPQARAREIIADAARRAGRSELTVAHELVRRFLPDPDAAASLHESKD